MAAITRPAGAAAASSFLTGWIGRACASVALAGLVLFLARTGLVLPAALVVVLAEMWPIGRGSWVRLPARTSWLVMGLAAALIIAVSTTMPLTQVTAAAIYALWRILLAPRADGRVRLGLAGLLVVQAMAFEALFLAAAVWGLPRGVVMAAVWLAVYATTYRELASRGERGAGVLAASWGLVAAEASWLFLTWLVSYITPGTYGIVPQPVVILTGLGYCFGSIYADQRRGRLNRGRLAEYSLIGLVLVWLVIAGTPWRGTL